MCPANALFLIIPGLFLLWGGTILYSCFNPQDDYDDDNFVVAVLNALPFFIVAIFMFSILTSGGQYFQLFVSYYKKFSQSEVKVLGISFFAVTFLLLLFAYKPFMTWRFKRWAEKNGYKLIAYYRY